MNLLIEVLARWLSQNIADSITNHQVERDGNALGS
jgi:hypothetical protein